MKVLILGGSGFIGQHVVTALLAAGHEVRVYDRHADTAIAKGIETVRASFDDKMSLSEALMGIDKVIHLISTSVPSTSNKDPVSDVSGNLINSLMLFELMRQSDIKDIIYFSSGGTVYGHPQQLPISEMHPTNPVCSYGIVKLAIEKYLLMYSELYGFRAQILRPSNPYGPGQQHVGVQGFIGTCIASALTNKKLTVWGDGEVRRDYLYVSDVADAAVAALGYQQTNIFNISSNSGYSINQILEQVQAKTQKSLNVAYQAKRNFDIAEVTLDNTKAAEILHWSPRVSLEVGLEWTVESFMNPLTES